MGASKSKLVVQSVKTETDQTDSKTEVIPTDLLITEQSIHSAKYQAKPLKKVHTKKPSEKKISDKKP